MNRTPTDVLDRSAKVCKLLLLGAVMAPIVMGTSAMVEWSPRLVTIGVDGMGTRHAEHKDTPVESCKAFRNGSTIFVAAGDIPERLKENVLTVWKWFEAGTKELQDTRLATSLNRMVVQNMTGDPVYYSKYKAGFVLLTILAARFNRQAVELRKTNFVISSVGSVTATATNMEGSNILCVCPVQPPMPKNWQTVDPVTTITDRLNWLYKVTDSFSGPPTTIIRVAPNAIDWVHYGNCKADGSNAWQQP